MEHGNGRKLFDKFCANYNIKSYSAGNTGTQMGGWYRKEIKSVNDLKGLKMRLGGGLFGETMAKLGVVSQNMPAGDVYQALERVRWTRPSSLAPTMTRSWALTRWRLTTTTQAGGKVVQSWSSS